MAACSDLASFEEFAEAAGIDTVERFEKAIEDGTMDAHVKRLTTYKNWKEMYSAAGKDYIRRELGL